MTAAQEWQPAPYRSTRRGRVVAQGTFEPPAGVGFIAWLLRGTSVVALLLAVAAEIGAPAAADSLAAFPEPSIAWTPRHYTCYRATSAIVIDGCSDEGDWQAAPWSEEFVDILGAGGPRPRFRTRVRMLWDDRCFYVAAEMEEPHVWATLAVRDTVIFYDNDFEVFIDPDGDTHEYYELEVNARGTEWDLLLVRPYRDGGPAVHGWDIPGLRTAVSVNGTLNDPRDDDRGWSIEIAFPWRALGECTYMAAPPRPGDCWRINFSRVEWHTAVHDGVYVKRRDPASGRPLPEDNWVWSPQGLVNMHYPEMWGFVEFTDRDAREAVTERPASRTADIQAGAISPATDALCGAVDAHGLPSGADRAAWVLRCLYYRQQTHHAHHGTFTEDPAALGIARPAGWAGAWPPGIATTPRAFEAWLAAPDGRVVRIRTDGRVWVDPR